MMKCPPAKLRALVLLAAIASTSIHNPAARAGETTANPAAQPSLVTAGGLEWRTDYGAAYQAAKDRFVTEFLPEAERWARRCGWTRPPVAGAVAR